MRLQCCCRKNIFAIIAPLLSAKKLSFKIIITGRNEHPSFSHLSKLSHASVRLAGEVKDIENYFAAADLFINPVEVTSGIQTKTIEALSYDLGVVCFNNTLNGIDSTLCPGKIFTANKKDYTDFVNQVIKAGLVVKSKTSDEFLKAYSMQAIAEKFAARLKSI